MIPHKGDKTFADPFRGCSQEGYSHSFVMEFESEEDCAYYSDEDPVHLDFINSTSGIVSKTLVVDFAPF